MGIRRPGIAKADRPRSGSLASLLDRIREDENALDAFVFAYLSLARSERWALAHAVVQDAQEPRIALAALLAAEEDQTLRQRLAGLLRGQGRIGDALRLRGTPIEGEVCLSHSVAGIAETLRIRWSAGKIEGIEIEPRDFPSFEGDAADDPPGVVDTVTPLLWRYIRKGGSLPEGVERFARFFSIT